MTPTRRTQVLVVFGVLGVGAAAVTAWLSPHAARRSPSPAVLQDTFSRIVEDLVSSMARTMS